MKYTFWNLIKVQGYKIVIPKIQRDYVQGRANITVKRNREEFVKELISSLAENKPMSLNFVYGTIQNGNEFIPIDGQQRLTTLFLLHLYVFAKNKDMEAIGMLQKQFSYETRYTTYRFLKKLAKELPQMLEMARYDESLAKLIRNSGWYVTPWDNDPNISSCIVMLDLIHEKCKGKTISTEILKDDCPITFMWLQLDKSFGSDNQLYIRMNSRGKQLTDFENFKAELYEKVLAGKDTEEFKKKIDGEWYSMLWDANVAESNVKDDKKIDIEKEALLIDSLLKRLIHWMIVSKACVERSIILKKERGGNKKELAKDEDAVKQKEEHDNLYQYCMPDGNEKIDVLRCGVEEYQSLVGKDGIKTCITEDLNSLLTFLTSIKGEKIFEYIVKDILAVSKEGDKSSYKINSYGPRVLLYAITKFAKIYEKKTETDERVNDFQSWYRIVLNLVSTKEIGRPEDFQKAVWAIAKWDKVTAKWLEEKDVKNAFRPEQVEEEKQKLNLIKSGEKWKDAILQAEKTDFDQGYQERDYFRGQIGFLLLMSKEDGDYNVNKFNKICEAAKKFFIDEYDDNLFHRALLTYGDYGTELKSINQEESGRTVSYEITTYFRKTRIHGAPDWRDALIVVNWDKEGSCKANKVYIALKSFIEEFINTSSAELEEFQNDKLEQYKDKLGQYNDGLPASLQDKLIMKRKMFEFTDNYFIKKEEKDILLRSKTKTGEKGRNWDYVDEYYDSSEGEEGQTP